MNSGKMVLAVVAMVAVVALQLVCAGCIAMPGRHGGAVLVAPLPVLMEVDGGGGGHGHHGR